MLIFTEMDNIIIEWFDHYNIVILNIKVMSGAIEEKVTLSRYSLNFHLNIYLSFLLAIFV